MSVESACYSFCQRVKTDPGTQPTFCPMATGDFFLGGKAAEAWSWRL